MSYDYPPGPSDQEAQGQADPGLAPTMTTRGGSSDPLFGLLLALAVSLGLVPSLPDGADLRYVLAWGALAFMGVLAWLLGNAERIGQEKPEDVAWGVGFGLLFGLPFLVFFGDTFGAAARLLFPEMSVGTRLALLVFVMPLGETLFFRGLLQRTMPLWTVAGLAGVWSVTLFLPIMWSEVLRAPAVAVFVVVALLAMQALYGYVQERNGLASAWLSQIVVNLLLFFLPRLA
ncbi:MAG: hypothetical protein NZ750_12260 [Anaerolineae bacterium]|nr:hypothetical protein [Anaerolineae bacterium]MDW8172112.1 hypothetical protein [Anaerolineae bacterium]